MRKILIMTLALGTLASAAHAEIRISEARYAAGVLVIRGETSTPYQTISVDGRYRKRSDEHKQFVFRVRYLPNDCTIRLTAGREAQPVVVSGCVSIDALVREQSVRTKGRSR